MDAIMGETMTTEWVIVPRVLSADMRAAMFEALIRSEPSDVQALFDAAVSAAPVPLSEPVGWRWRVTGHETWVYWKAEPKPGVNLVDETEIGRDVEVQPLYAVPPSPPRDEGKLKKRPVAFRVRMMGDCPWEYYGDEDAARQAADVYCGDYEALYVRDGTPVNLDPPRDEVVEALRKLRLTARVLLQNSDGCAVNHYGRDYIAHGRPGWLADCEKDIERAEAAISKLEGRS